MSSFARRCLGLLAAAPLLVSFTGTVASAQNVSRGIVTGRVFDAVTEAPVDGATIRVVGQAEARVSSGADGRFTIPAVRTGIIRLEVRRLGYQPIVRSDVAVSAGSPTVVVIALTRASVRLQAVTVRPSAFPQQAPASTPVSSTVLTSEELRRTPGALEDVVQALSIAPGIASTAGGRNDLFVRGGAAFENLFVVDNIEVPNINHFGSQGSTGGPISLLNIRFIDHVNLSVGGYGVRFGDRVSSATDITLREGNRERTSGALNVSASQYGAVVEGPIGGHASFIANVRRSYLDLLFKALGQSFIPSYTDATVKGSWRPSARDDWSFLLVGALDQVSFTNASADDRFENSRVLAPQQDQYFSGLTWKRRFASGVATTTLGRTWTRYRTAQYDSLEPPNAVFSANTTEGENSWRTDVTWLATPTLEIDAGNIAKYASRLRYEVNIPAIARVDDAGVPHALHVDTSFTAFRNATYIQGAWQASTSLRLSMGLRGDYANFLGHRVAIAPRASVTWRLDEPTSLTLSVGRYTQAPQYLWLVGDPSNRTALAPLRADQAVLSLQRIVGDEWRWQLEGFVKRYAHYPARAWRPNAVLQPSGYDDVRSDIPFGLEPLQGRGRGRVWGIEGVVQKKLGRVPVYGVATVSYNHTSFTGLDGSSTRGAFDTPIVANLVAGWRPNARWELSGRTRTSTGLPYTPFVAAGAHAGTSDFSRYNAERLPYFLSVDARVDRRWVVRRSQLVTYLDIANINGRLNVSGYQWNDRLQATEALQGIRVLPTIGITWEF